MNRKPRKTTVTRRRADGADAAVGRRIRSRRLDCGLSQTKLAIAIGVTFQQVQKYENGTSRISASRLEKIAKTLHTSIAFFFGGSSQPGYGLASPDAESVFEILQTARAVRLLKAFSKIRGRKAQQLLIDFVEEFGPD
jgi:transcriptional regulator with XRE-family HTH domain